MSATEDSNVPFAYLVNKYANSVFTGVNANGLQTIFDRLSDVPTSKDKFIAMYSQDKEASDDYDNIPGIANVISAYVSITEHTTNFQNVTLPEIISLSKSIQDYLEEVNNSREGTESKDPEIISKTIVTRFKLENLNQLVKRAGDLVTSIARFFLTTLNDRENFLTSFEQPSTKLSLGSKFLFAGVEVYAHRLDLFNLINITSNLQALWASVLSILQNIKQDVDITVIKAKASQEDYQNYDKSAMESFKSLKDILDNYNLSALITTPKTS